MKIYLRATTKELEDHIFDNDCLAESIGVYGKPYRQVDLGGYGIIDLLYVDFEPDFPVKMKIVIVELKKEIKQVLSKKDSSWAKTEIKLEVEEIRDPSSHAAVMASDICLQIEKRMPYRRVMKQIIDKIMQSREVKGAKIMISGRLNGAEIARREWLKEGRIPLQTLRSDIDYAQATAYTTYGTIGVKVWIYKGEIFKDHVAAEKSKT